MLTTKKLATEEITFIMDFQTFLDMGGGPFYPITFKIRSILHEYSSGLMWFNDMLIP